MLTHLIMLASALVCFVIACRMRGGWCIAASALMLTAMIDHALTGFVPVTVWALVLIIAGVVHAWPLRHGSDGQLTLGSPGLSVQPGGTHTETLARSLAVLGSLSYPIMAGALLAGASAGSRSSAIVGAGAHATHGAALNLLAVTAGVAAVALLLAFLALVIITAVRKHAMHSIGAVGNAGMMLGVLLPFTAVAV